MNKPFLLEGETFQKTWAQAVNCLNNNSWELWDLVVRIDNPLILDESVHEKMTAYSEPRNLTTPDRVAQTIFPFGIVKEGRDFKKICDIYLKKFYPLSLKMRPGQWGTYFYRMINYPTVKNDKIVYINQLGNILNAIKNDHDTVRKAAYTMVISKPGGENTKPLGIPCLNSVAIKQERLEGKKYISLLAIYRNHDFNERAYGNYYGLCKLLEYISKETNSQVGSVTCISSHATFYNGNNSDKKILLGIAEQI